MRNYHDANVSKPFPIWVVFRNNPNWKPPASNRWSKTDMCWTRAEAEYRAQENREVPLPKEPK